MTGLRSYPHDLMPVMRTKGGMVNNSGKYPFPRNVNRNFYINEKSLLTFNQLFDNK